METTVSVFHHPQDVEVGFEDIYDDLEKKGHLEKGAVVVSFPSGEMPTVPKKYYINLTTTLTRIQDGIYTVNGVNKQAKDPRVIQKFMARCVRTTDQRIYFS